MSKVSGILVEHIVVDETSITTKQIELKREEIENDAFNLIFQKLKGDLTA